jgi:hypothetical protein
MELHTTNVTPYIKALRVVRDTLRNADYVTNPDIANDLVDEAMMIIDLVLMDDTDEKTTAIGSLLCD